MDNYFDQYETDSNGIITMSTVTRKNETVIQSITTRTLPATNTKPTRVVATTASGLKHTAPLDHDISLHNAHWQVAAHLAAKLNWNGEWIQGATSDGYVFVLLLDDVK